MKHFKFENLDHYTQEKQLELFHEYKKGNKQAGVELVTSNLKLFIYLLRRMNPRLFKVHHEDLLQNMWVQTLARLKHFNPEKGTLTTFFYWSVKGTLTNFIRKEVQKKKEKFVFFSELDFPETLFAEEETDQDIQNDSKQQVKKLLKILTPKEKTVLEMRYGLKGKVYEQKAIAKLFNVSTQWICFIENKAIKKLQEESNVKVKGACSKEEALENSKIFRAYRAKKKISRTEVSNRFQVTSRIVRNWEEGNCSKHKITRVQYYRFLEVAQNSI